jgi:hypothetical protein
MLKRLLGLRFRKAQVLDRCHIGKDFLFYRIILCKEYFFTFSIFRNSASLCLKWHPVKTVNVTFSKLVKLDSRQWEVNFRKLPTLPYQFHADTATLQGERIQFSIYRESDSSWRIAGRDIPEIISHSSDKLGSALERGMEEFYPGLL